MRDGQKPTAVARIQGGEEFPQIWGWVRFYPRRCETIVEAEIFGLPMAESQFFGFHIHEGTDCCGTGFRNTGSHLNLFQTAHPNHVGDLPPLLGVQGRAYMKVLTDRFCVEEAIGRTVIIHGGPDDFRTQPSGNAGKKIACGVIHPI